MRKFFLTFEIEDDTSDERYKSRVVTAIPDEADGSIEAMFIGHMTQAIYRYEYKKRTGSSIPYPSFSNPVDLSRLDGNISPNFQSKFPEIARTWKEAVRAHCAFHAEIAKLGGQNEQANSSTDRQSPEVGEKTHRESRTPTGDSNKNAE